MVIMQGPHTAGVTTLGGIANQSHGSTMLLAKQ